jgi:diguanylate cyclase (GGDEF)-like protein
MPAQIVRAHPVGYLDPGSLIEDLAVGVLVLGRLGDVVFANTLASAILAPIDAAGLTLDALGQELVRIGRWSTEAAAALCRITASSSDRPCVVEENEGRALALTARARTDGGWVVTLDDVTHHRAANRIDQRDGLTGLASRGELDERLKAFLAAVQREGGQAALVCLDLDRFKAVNDTLGHPVGDALLKMVAQRLRSAVREGDVVARLGGDEFAILQIGGEQPQAADALARRLVDLIGRTYVAQGHMLNIGTSVGIALVPEDGLSADTLLRNADLALYRAKADGRGTFRFFKPEMDERMQARRGLEIDLRKALALKEFELVYQPQTRIEGDTVVGFEALLRWRHPDRGLVSPADFIPLAEEIGLITPIGEWVLRTACREAALWPDSITIAVNLSAVQFRGSRLLDTVTSALAGSGLAAARLELEITEGALLEDTDAVLAVLNGLRELGVRVSMDDFGTGYSSLSYLQKFPFDKIKIDQSFVRSMASDRDSAAIIRAVTSLGSSFGMTTIAEGVETPEQLARIRAEGCTEAQGYLISRPLTPEAARAFIAARVA